MLVVELVRRQVAVIAGLNTTAAVRVESAPYSRPQFGNAPPLRYVVPFRLEGRLGAISKSAEYRGEGACEERAEQLPNSFIKAHCSNRREVADHGRL
jgi:hypothetical protein